MKEYNKYQGLYKAVKQLSDDSDKKRDCETEDLIEYLKKFKPEDIDEDLIEDFYDYYDD